MTQRQSGSIIGKMYRFESQKITDRKKLKWYEYVSLILKNFHSRLKRRLKKWPNTSTTTRQLWSTEVPKRRKRKSWRPKRRNRPPFCRRHIRPFEVTSIAFSPTWTTTLTIKMPCPFPNLESTLSSEKVWLFSLCYLKVSWK